MADSDYLCPIDAINGLSGIIIVKWDRLCAHALLKTASGIFPGASIWVCHSGAQALAALRESRAQLGLFGLDLPDIDGLDLLIRIKEERLVDRVLVVSTRNNEHSHQVLRRVAIAGFFDCQGEDGDNLHMAIHRVGSGGCYFSPDRMAPPRAGRPTLNQLLSRTELEVFAVIGDGSSDQEAADCLKLSATTVHCHRQHIMRKLAIQTRAALIRAAIERGVIRFSANRILRPGMERILAHRQSSASPPGQDGVSAAQGQASLEASSL